MDMNGYSSIWPIKAMKSVATWFVRLSKKKGFTANATNGGTIQLTGSVTVGNTVANSSGLYVANSLNSSQVTSVQFYTAEGSNTTLANTRIISIANSTSSANVDPISFKTGIFVGNTTAAAVGANVIANSSALYIGNTTVNTAVNDSARGNLVFPFGKKAIRRLRSSNGSVNSTEFYFRYSSTGTIQTNGNISITSPSSYTGGTDQLGYSTGVLGDTLEEQFLVVMASNVSTVNISGTVNVSSTSTTINTTGLNSYFANGEFIKIYANTTTIDYRRVVTVNATSMVVDANLSVTNTTSNFGKHYPAGYTFPLEATYPGTRQVNITSATTFDVSTGAASAANLASTGNVVVNRTTNFSKDVNVSGNLTSNGVTVTTSSSGTWSSSTCSPCTR